MVVSIGIDNKHLISSTFYVQGGKTHPSQYHPPHSASSVPQSLYEGEQFACQSPIQAFVWPVSPVWSIVIFFTVIIIITPKFVTRQGHKTSATRILSRASCCWANTCHIQNAKCKCIAVSYTLVVTLFFRCASIS